MMTGFVQPPVDGRSRFCYEAKVSDLLLSVTISVSIKRATLAG